MLSGDRATAQGREGPFAHLLRHFAAYWDRIDVLTPGGPGTAPRQPAPNVYLHPSTRSLAWQPFFILSKGRQLFAQRDYALVVSHDYGVFYNGLAALLLTAGAGVPIVSEIHHVEGHPFALIRKELIYRRLARGYISLARHWVRAFRVVNRAEVPDFLRTCGVPDSQMRYLPSMYLDFDVFRPNPQAEKRYDVLFVGRLTSNKGLPTILEALAIVKRTHPQVSLCILGQGPLQAPIEAQIETLRLSPNVTLIPHLPDSQTLVALYQQARMLVCASTAEGGPRVTIEAMACGIPVISTPVGLMKDLLEDGRNFLVFHWGAEALAQKIILLLEQPHLRQQLAQNGELAVQGFRAEEVIAQYARAYHELARGG